MTTAFRKIGACRLCGSEILQEYLDFGSVPLGNNLQSCIEAARAAESYPLTLQRCSVCRHFQLGYAVDPKILYATNYTYLSGIGASFVKHFAGYSDWVATNCDLSSKSIVVDVGSNDGTCLKSFRDRGYTVCGVDPATLAAKIAVENGIETINAFFDSEAVAEIKRRHGPADFVTSHNVLAHVDDLGAVFRNVHNLLKEGGYFAFEVGYFREVLSLGHFDTIYHEHLDYHHAAPLVRHLTALGFDVLDLSVNQVQGGSIRLLLRKTGQGAIYEAAAAFLEAEQTSVLYDEKYLTSWPQEIKASMVALHELLRNRIDRGLRIVGYGAPTKATLLMKVAGIGAGEIEYVVEDNRYKTGRFFPTSGVPIKPSTALEGNPPDIVVIFAWNFADDIIRNLTGKMAKAVEVIVPLPKLRSIIL